MKKILLAFLYALLVTGAKAQVEVTALTEQFANGVWKDVSKDSAFVYNADCLPIYHVVKTWDSSSNAWDNNLQLNLSYTGTGKVYQDTERQWNSASASWRNYYLLTDAYDGSNFLINEMQRMWDTSVSLWQNYYKIDYTNNMDGTAQTATAFVWAGGVWDTNLIEHFVYNTPGRLDTMTATASPSPGVWQNSTRQCYAYNLAGHKTNMFMQYWITATSSWQNLQRQTFVPDGAMPDSLIIDTWNTTTNSWDASLRVSYAYAPCTAVGVANLNDFKQVEIYPNPSNGIVTVNLGAIPADNTLLTITSVLGQKVGEYCLTARITTIDTKFSPGVYFIKVANGKESISRKLNIQ